MPLIVQQQIHARFAGALFPSDPLSSAKGVSVVEAVGGFAGPLLAGHAAPTTIHITDSTSEMVSDASDVPINVLLELRRAGRAIEEAIGEPCDIEWASTDDDLLYFIQLRPVVHGRYDQASVAAIQDHGVNSEDPKVRLRQLARTLGIRMSQGWLLRTSSSSDLSENLSDIPGTGLYSVVLIDPPLLGGKVLRQFTPAATLRLTLTDVARTALRDFWKCTVIIKEILEGEFTGVAVRDEHGYWIEIAAGHFVPKGVVPVSTFRFGRDKRLLFAETKSQEYAYAISTEGATKRIQDAGVLAPPTGALVAALDSFDKVWDVLPSVLEYGLTRDGSPYLIDYTPGTAVDADLVNSGVISTGIARGRLVRSSDEVDERLSGNWHAKDSTEPSSSEDAETIVIAAKRPYIALLRHLNVPSMRVGGFVFEESGVLNHLAVQLRERRIPAIVCTRAHIDVCVGGVVTVDGTTASIRGDARLISERAT